MNYGEGTEGWGGEIKQSPINRKRGLEGDSNNDNGKTVYKRRGVSVENGAYGSNDSPFNTLYKPPEQQNVGLDLSSSFVTKRNETIHNNTRPPFLFAIPPQRGTPTTRLTRIGKSLSCPSSCLPAP